MNSTATLSKKQSTANLSDEQPLVYELSTQVVSGWVPKKKEHKKAIKTTKYTALDTRSRYDAGKEGMLETQYVPGAATIHLNNVADKDGNIQKGLLETYGREALRGELYRQAVQEDIKFVDGILFLEHYGGLSNQRLVDFINNHQFNEGGRNFKRNGRMNPLFLFRPILKEKKAAASLDKLDVEFSAYELLKSLSSENGKTREYDTAKINAILNILQEGLELADNESGQKLLLIRSFIHRNAVAFMEVYNDAVNESTEAIKVATSVGAVTFTDKAASIKVGDLLPINIDLKKTKREDQIEELSFYLIGTQEGRILNMQIGAEVEKKKIEALGKK